MVSPEIAQAPLTLFDQQTTAAGRRRTQRWSRIWEASRIKASAICWHSTLFSKRTSTNILFTVSCAALPSPCD